MEVNNLYMQANENLDEIICHHAYTARQGKCISYSVALLEARQATVHVQWATRRTLPHFQEFRTMAQFTVLGVSSVENNCICIHYRGFFVLQTHVIDYTSK